MKLFEMKPQFNPGTGKKMAKGKMAHTADLCDWCGRKIGTDDNGTADMEDIPVRLALHEYDGLEPTFHEMGKNLPCDRYDLMNEHPEFVYCCQDGNDCTLKIAQQAAKLKVSLPVLIYEGRISLVTKLIKDGTYKLADFNLE
jgi:hypothetical protein